MFQNLLIFVVLAINFFLGVVVVFDKHRTRENWLYGFFVLVMNFWILSNYFENESRYFNLNALELFLRIDFCLAAVVFYMWHVGECHWKVLNVNESILFFLGFCCLF